MDVPPTITIMENLIKQLAVTEVDCCTDVFLITLNKLMTTATDLILQAALTREKENADRRRRLTYTSTSSDDVRCISAEVVTVNVDSDDSDSENEETTKSVDSSSEEDQTTDESSNNQTAIEVAIPTPSVNLKRLTTQSPPETEQYKKRCTVNLKRIDLPGSTSTIHELNTNIIPGNNGTHSATVENDQKKKLSSGQVSENENISEENLRPVGLLGRYTYEDYRKRFHDGCSMQ